MGWFKEAELNNEWDFDVDVVRSNMTLYAKWDKSPEDPLYPTTYYVLSDKELSQKINDFKQKNPNAISTLNEFGFCKFGSSSPNPDSIESCTEEEAINIVKEFIEKNPEYTGIKDYNNITYRYVTSISRNDGSLTWTISINNQKINDIEVYNTLATFHVFYRGVIRCFGNHFPDIYIPDKFNIDIEKAKKSLLGKEIFHSTHGGKVSAGIINIEHIEYSQHKIVVRPIETKEKIELRVAWRIYLPAKSYIFEIDVMTGEILAEYQDFIS